jgi:hypothetical protein
LGGAAVVVKESDKRNRRDWLVTAALVLVSLALRVPYRSHLAYHWDCAEFALAISKYDVSSSQPHPPGYFLYVMLGRLVNLFVGDPHASLVWLSVAFGSALAGLMYLLGLAMFDRRTGLVAGLFTMTSPQVWFHSEVALTYVVDAFLVSLTVFWCWRAMDRGGTWWDAVIIGGLVAIVGGVRQQSVPALAVLVAFATWNFQNHRCVKLAVTAGVALVFGLFWFVPMVSLSGGLSSYLQEVQRHAAFNAPATLVGGGWDAFVWNVFFAGLFCLNGLMLGAVLLVGGLVYRTLRLTPTRRNEWNRRHGRAMGVLAVWMLSFAAFGTLGFTKQPGYVLSYLPGFILLSAMVVGHLCGLTKYSLVAVAVCAVNIVAFTSGIKAFDDLFVGTALSASRIFQHDQRLQQTIEFIRAHYRPSDVAVCHAHGNLYFGLRHFQFYLPEFDNYQLAPDAALVAPAGRPLLSAKGGRLQFTTAIDLNRSEQVLLIVPPGENVLVFQPYVDIRSLQPVVATGGIVYSTLARNLALTN